MYVFCLLHVWQFCPSRNESKWVILAKDCLPLSHAYCPHNFVKRTLSIPQNHCFSENKPNQLLKFLCLVIFDSNVYKYLHMCSEVSYCFFPVFSFSIFEISVTIMIIELNVNLSNFIQFIWESKLQYSCQVNWKAF